jgi:putative ABC transport system permease protein
MSAINQISHVTALNIRSIPQRLGASLVIVFGIAGVVAVLVAMFAMAEGFKHTLGTTGRNDRAIVIRSGSQDELSSGFDRDQALVVEAAPGVRKGDDGRPLASFERYVLTDVVKRGNNEPGNVPVRGVDPVAFKLRPELKIVEGRMPTPGTREMLVGRNARSQFKGAEVGGRIPVREGDWDVVGVFETGGDVHETELWVDRATLAGALRSEGVSSVLVQLEDEKAFDAFKDSLSADKRVRVDVKRQRDYYAAQSKALGIFISVIGGLVSIIMGVGAVFAALNTMYSAVAARTTEIATLRALGFGAGAVLTSVLLEALILAAIGGAIGAALAFAVFNGFTVSTLNFQTFSQVAFAFRVTPALVAQGLFGAIAIGLLGGLLPALRAARLPITTALRAL